MSFKQAQSFKRGQIWEAGFDGIYNTENAVDSITGKVGEQRSSRPAVESTTQQIARQREREAFDRTVISRAENFKQAFSKFDLDGDGRLSFDEFSQGLHQLGVMLPRNEVEAIWSQVKHELPLPFLACSCLLSAGKLYHDLTITRHFCDDRKWPVVPCKNTRIINRHSMESPRPIIRAPSGTPLREKLSVLVPAKSIARALQSLSNLLRTTGMHVIISRICNPRRLMNYSHR